MELVRRFGVALAALLFVVLLPARAEAVSYTFSACLTSNYSGCSSLPSQMIVEVTDAGGGFVDFRFTNDATIASSITALYFDVADGLLTSIQVEDESDGVDFKTTNVSPPDVPGASGADPDFVVTAGLAADSQGAPKGINEADEYLVLRMQLGAGKNFDDIIEALDAGPGSDSLRIAAHIQQLPGGKSDSLICCGTGTPSPEPASLSLFGLAAMGVAYRLRRRRSVRWDGPASK